MEIIMRAPLFLIITLVLLTSLGVPVPAEAETRKDVVGFWTFYLEPGFNLVTFPVLPDTPTLNAVIGDRLGAVEITCWDSGIGRYRWARYDPESDDWSGDLFLLSRGTAYWINLLDNNAQVRLIVTGHPEVYTQFSWRRLGNGWKYYGPTYGKARDLAEIPPDIAGDLVVAWNKDLERFELAEGNALKRWYSPDFERIMPDRGYIAYVKSRPVRRIGVPTKLEADKEKFEDNSPPRDDGPNDNRGYSLPPNPLVVGNSESFALCFENGEICSRGLVINVMREGLRLGLDGEPEPYLNQIDRFELPDGGIEPGKFKIALTVSESESHLNPGDRVYLQAQGPGGTTSRSVSFEIPESERFLTDIRFPNPLVSGGIVSIAPETFALGKPFPNPFNDRFSIEFDLPATELVEYRIFDLRGRQVHQSSRPMSAGQHRMTVSASNMSTGIYLLELKAGSSRGIAKVAHIK